MTLNKKAFTLLLTLFAFVYLLQAQEKNIDNSTTDNKRLFLFVVDHLFNKGDTTIADKYFVADFAKEEKAFTALIRSAFPDLKIQIDILVAENDLVAARWIATGTHKGLFLGVQPTHKLVSWKGSWFWTFKNGKIVDGMGKGSWDAMGLLKELQAK